MYLPLTAGLLLLLWMGLHLLLRSAPLRTPMMISHRGAAGLAPENTLAAIRAGVEAGAEYIEVDVQRSADGVLVILHDGDVQRTTNGSGRVGALPWADLQRLDAGSWFGPAYTGEPLPSLEGVLDLMQAGSWRLVLEGKDPARYPGIEVQIAEAILRAGLSERIVLVSFDHTWLARARDQLPRIPQSRLSVWASPFATQPPAESESVFWVFALLDPTLIRRVHARGEEVRIWTVNHVGLMQLLLWLGVDAITTDHPERWPLALERAPARAAAQGQAYQ